MQDSVEIAKVFKALCDPTRVTILKCLKDQERCACDIAERLEISQPKLSYHMKILCESGIVECWYVGKWTHYRIDEAGGEYAMKLLSEIVRKD